MAHNKYWKKAYDRRNVYLAWLLIIQAKIHYPPKQYLAATPMVWDTFKRAPKSILPFKKGNSALSEHTCQTNHTIAWDNSKIITTNRRYHQRRCLEAWHINSAHAPLNRDDGGLLPDAYLHLINRWCHHPKSSIKGRYVAKAWKLGGGGGGVCAYLPDLKNIFEIYLYSNLPLNIFEI